ncbi:MAG: WD40 repeat domain-containing protein [Jiangellaceae bacterium]|nr:WD40 repeat domain-containing protein [Jiangellaceae bacterium]
MRPLQRLPTLVGLGLGVGVVVLAIAFPLQGTADERTGPATLPDRMASYSHLTGDVSDSPPGRAIALFQHGFGVELFDFPQAIVVSADEDLYRRLDEAEDRAGPETQGDPAPMLLSPQGTHVAVGDHDTNRPDLAVVDLRTGRTSSYPLPEGRSVLPIAWSPDGSQVAYLFEQEQTNPYAGVPLGGSVGLLNVHTGEAAALPGASDVRTAAFHPDGTELVLQHGKSAGGTLRVASLVDASARIIDAGKRLLDGPAAWSPDGRLLATTRPDTCRFPELGPCAPVREISFVDATGEGRPVPEPLELDAPGPNRVLGWTAPDEVVVLAGPSLTEVGHDPERWWLTAVPVDGREPRRLTWIPGGGQYGVGRFQLASVLLPDVRVREASGMDRGPWPAPLRFGTAALSGMIAAALTSGVMKRRQRWNQSS